ncbi:MAG: aminopeptidase [Spirochaetia bacterium]|nr:aminopeptidase [Spirochaetia bacterium]
MKRLVSIRVALVIFFQLLSSCYLAHAANGQASLLWNREPIDEVLTQPQTDPKISEKLRHVKEVSNWGHDKLGLKGEAFQTLSRIDRKAVAWNVTASRELAFIPKTWWFPIVGTVPYLGYFSEAKANAAAQELKAEGWDVVTQEVSGYSTLGWFKDPLVSTQLEYSNWYLTRLVIHESTHNTLWLPGSVDFNESFASFVEITGALQYARETEGESSENYKRKLNYLVESAKIRAQFRACAKKLDALYKSNLTDVEKRAQKSQIIQAFKRQLTETRAPNQTADQEQREYNNADFLSFLRYESGQEYFEEQFKSCRKEWPCFFAKMQALTEPPANWKKQIQD